MRWGVAGYGDVVARRVLPALRTLGEEPVALWGRDRRRAAEQASLHGVDRADDDPAVLLTGTDAVYVATPVSLHLPFAQAAMAAGLPVLVEKPLCGTVPRAGVDLPARGGAGVAYYRRLAPAVRRMAYELAEAGTGPVRAEVRFRMPFAPGPDHSMYWRTDVRVSGGGVLADAGSHRVDLLLALLGPPAEVRARLTGRFPGGAERRAEVRMRWPEGDRADCLFEWSDGPPTDSFVVERGFRTVVLDPLDGGRLRRADRDGVVELFLPPAENPHRPLVADFVAAVAAGVPPVCPLTEAERVDAVLVAAARSDSAGGRPVTPVL
ncbi:Gfo/Idh/MocA family oxidoreductase [Streptomyces xiaopingdaonensis]|uniref:Gfo/Idh/MocA family oxidoreductase n=1 Tax=Streptomyces xiaopingdaonensis TaxID=1565415 RepID=UPI0003162C75|nr:Gfo/Idh/MocA family oxidoreductase [Streptomyces xiaopingdaonensis]